ALLESGWCSFWNGAREGGWDEQEDGESDEFHDVNGESLDQIKSLNPRLSKLYLAVDLSRAFEILSKVIRRGKLEFICFHRTRLRPLEALDGKPRISPICMSTYVCRFSYSFGTGFRFHTTSKLINFI